jgi:aspartate kinase
MIVLKFGGSSVDTPESIERVIGIVLGLRSRRPAVVVSAMGKTTRNLLECAEAAATGGPDLPTAYASLDELEAFHVRVARAVTAPVDQRALTEALERWFRELRTTIEAVAAEGRLTPRATDAVAGFGELLASSILSFALGIEVEAPWIDCRQVIVTDDAFSRARPIEDATETRLRDALLPHLAAGCVPVLGGYVGATRDGVTTTLGKEGSDFSAAIVGAALGAEEVQIWTDVDGMMTADPRLVAAARRVRTLSFAEALELSCSGAKKPHYGTLGPASRAQVPIRILNSRHPGRDDPDAGTVIGTRSAAAPPTIKSITWRDNARRITVRSSPGGTDSASFLAGVLDVCDRFRPSLLVLRCGDGEVELALDRKDRLFEIHAALAGSSRVAEVRLAPGRTVVTAVSEDLASSPELAGRVLRTEGELAPRLVVRGAAAPCVRWLLGEESPGDAVAVLHQQIFGENPGEVVE